MGYVMQKYEETAEYHLYKAHYNENKQIIIDDVTPLCGNPDVSFCRHVNLAFKSNNLKTENAMAVACADQEASIRHQICANCVGRFYKTH